MILRFFKSTDLDSHNRDVIIKNGGQRRNQGFIAYIDRATSPVTIIGYNGAEDKGLFVIDSVIGPLLAEGRHFYIYDETTDIYRMLDLNDASDLKNLVNKITQKIRDVRKKGERHWDPTPIQEFSPLETGSTLFTPENVNDLELILSND